MPHSLNNLFFRHALWNILFVACWAGAAGLLDAASGIASSAADSATLPPDAAAMVNGEAIPKKLVAIFLKNDREALSLDASTDQGRQALAELPRRILDELIDRLLISQGVRERRVAPTDADFDAAEARMITFCGSPARYDAFVAQNGFTRAEYRDNVLRTQLNGKAMIEALTKGLEVSEAELRAEYDAHAAEPDFQWPERVRGSHILIKAQPGVLSAALEQEKGLVADSPEMAATLAEKTERRRLLAESIRAKALVPGADFAALAREFSEDVGTRGEGGSLGTFAYGVHPAALDDAFFKLSAGAIGPLVQTNFGFHVIRTDERLPAGRRTFEEVAPELRRRLLQGKAAGVLRDWLKQARHDARIVTADQTAN